MTAIWILGKFADLSFQLLLKMQQVWKLWGASLRVQECKAKGPNAAPTWAAKESQ